VVWILAHSSHHRIATGTSLRADRADQLPSTRDDVRSFKRHLQ
jgi:hypothetical protein